MLDWFVSDDFGRGDGRHMLTRRVCVHLNVPMRLFCNDEVILLI
jgi:hypothetical protein